MTTDNVVALPVTQCTTETEADKPVKNLRGYQFKMQPTPEQAEQLHEYAGMCGVLWNQCDVLQTENKLRIDEQKKAGEIPMNTSPVINAFGFIYMVTPLRKASAKWGALTVNVPREVCKNYALAYKAARSRLKKGDPGPVFHNVNHLSAGISIRSRFDLRVVAV